MLSFFMGIVIGRVISVRVADDVEKLLDEAMSLRKEKIASRVVNDALRIGLRYLIEKERRKKILRDVLEEMLKKDIKIRTSKIIDVEKNCERVKRMRIFIDNNVHNIISYRNGR